MELAFKICSSESIISEEFCSFHGKDGRVKNFKTLTASAYHTLLKPQIPLAIMECKHEDSTHVELFWCLFMKLIRKQTTQMKSSIQQVGRQIWPQVVSVI